MINDIYPDFLQMIDDGFSDMDDAIVNALPESNEHYADMIAREQELMRRFPKIENWLEEEGSLTLTAEEHAGLVEYIELAAEKEDVERLSIYYAGHKDCYAYLKKIGAIP